jgi:hypothetical protein
VLSLLSAQHLPRLLGDRHVLGEEGGGVVETLDTMAFVTSALAVPCPFNTVQNFPAGCVCSVTLQRPPSMAVKSTLVAVAQG